LYKSRFLEPWYFIPYKSASCSSECLPPYPKLYYFFKPSSFRISSPSAIAFVTRLDANSLEYRALSLPCLTSSPLTALLFSNNRFVSLDPRSLLFPVPFPYHPAIGSGYLISSPVSPTFTPADLIFADELPTSVLLPQSCLIPPFSFLSFSRPRKKSQLIPNC